MKKLLGILLTFIMFFAIGSIAFATPLTVSADSATTLNFNVTSDGANSVTKKTGNIITVTFTIENATDKSAGYNISSFANEIHYDHTFFEEVENSAKVASDVNGFSKFDVYSWGEHRAFFNGFQIPTAQYAAKQVIGSFQLKIIATEGSSTINSVNGTMFAYDQDAYTLTKTGLVVNIGDAPTPQAYEVSFNTNGGNDISSISVPDGEKLTKPADPTKDGMIFAGWYKDAECTEAWNFDTDTVTESTTLYAKWVEKQPGIPDSSSSDSEPEKPDDSSSSTMPPANSGTSTDILPIEYNLDSKWVWLLLIVVFGLALISCTARRS